MKKLKSIELGKVIKRCGIFVALVFVTGAITTQFQPVYDTMPRLTLTRLQTTQPENDIIMQKTGRQNPSSPEIITYEVTGHNNGGARAVSVEHLPGHVTEVIFDNAVN